MQGSATRSTEPVAAQAGHRWEAEVLVGDNRAAEMSRSWVQADASRDRSSAGAGFCQCANRAGSKSRVSG